MTALLDLQRRMVAAVMEPLTRSEAMRQRRSDGVAMAQEASEFIKPGRTLTSFERLEIYNRQYWFRLYASFEEDFPGLRAVLGRKRFEQVMRAYIADRPSTSYTLRDLGSRLPGWLVEHQDLTGTESVLALDVARLEWAHIEAYDGASYPLPSAGFLASITEERRIGLQPCVRLLALSYPADEFMVRLRQDAGSSDGSSNSATATRRVRPTRRFMALPSEPVWLAVHRQEFTVYYKRLLEEEYRMLVAVQAGDPLGEALAKGFAHSSIAEQDRPTFLQECFQQWTILGWLHEVPLALQMHCSGDPQ